MNFFIFFVSRDSVTHEFSFWRGPKNYFLFWRFGSVSSFWNLFPDSLLIIFTSQKLYQKYRCEFDEKCVGYTFEQSRFNCILHSSTDKGFEHTRGKQTGVKRTDYSLSLPEISLCFEKNRQRRCKREPKCQHVDCLRKALKVTNWNLSASELHKLCSM